MRKEMEEEVKARKNLENLLMKKLKTQSTTASASSTLVPSVNMDKDVEENHT